MRFSFQPAVFIKKSRQEVKKEGFMFKMFKLKFYIFVLPQLFLVWGTTDAAMKNGFELKGALVPKSEILEGGPPKDGIPALMRPQFVTQKQIKGMFGKAEKAIVVEFQGKQKAYPISILNWHEIVNDSIGGKAIVVTYCPLCGTGMVFDAKIGNQVLSFGVSGLLYKSDVLLYDRQTNSLWSQIWRKAITGRYKSRELKLIPSKMVPLCMKANSRQVKGWQFARETCPPTVAARTCAKMQELFVTLEISLRFWLFHAGETSLKIAGSSQNWGANHPIPKPSPFKGSSLSFE